MRNIVVRPSRMLTTPSTVIKNKGDGDFDNLSSEDLDDLDFQLNTLVKTPETAAIPLSEYRQWGGHGQFDRAKYEKIFRKYTGNVGRFRIYLPIREEDVPKTKRVSIVPDAILKVVDEKGYAIDDYVAGIAVDKKSGGKRKIKIGKLLSDNPDLKKLFDADPQRHSSKTSKSTMLAVISRHPYDLMGMSTYRGWISCMNVKDGCNKEYVLKDLKYGTLVAYLVKADDKNINHPIGRVRIYSFLDKADHSRFMFIREPQTYPKDATLPHFEKAIDRWVEDVNSFLGVDTKGGVYCLSPKEAPRDIYTDDVEKTIQYIGSLQDLLGLGNSLSNTRIDQLRVGKDFDFEGALNSKNPIAIRVALNRSSVSPHKLVELLDLENESMPGMSAKYSNDNYHGMIDKIINSRSANDAVWLKVINNFEKFDDYAVLTAAKKLRLDPTLLGKTYEEALAKYKAKSNSGLKAILEGFLQNPMLPKKYWKAAIVTRPLGRIETNHVYQIYRERTDITDEDRVSILNQVKDKDYKQKLARYTVEYYYDETKMSEELLLALVAVGGTVATNLMLRMWKTLGADRLEMLMGQIPINSIPFHSLHTRSVELTTKCVLDTIDRLEAVSKENPDWLDDISGHDYMGEFFARLPASYFADDAFITRLLDLIIGKDKENTRVSHTTLAILNELTFDSKVFLNTVFPRLFSDSSAALRHNAIKQATKLEIVLSEKILMKAISDKAYEVQKAVVQYAAAPLSEAFLMKAVKSKHGAVAKYAASDNNRTLAIIEQAFKHKDYEVRRAIFHQSFCKVKVPEYIVKLALKDKDQHVQAEAIKNVQDPALLDVETLIELAESNSWRVREAVAGNNNTPDEVILNLIKEDEDYDVRNAATKQARKRNLPGYPKLGDSYEDEE